MWKTTGQEGSCSNVWVAQLFVQGCLIVFILVFSYKECFTIGGLKGEKKS